MKKQIIYSCGCRRDEARPLDVHWDNGEAYQKYLEDIAYSLCGSENLSAIADVLKDVYQKGYQAGRESVIDLIDDLFYTGMSSIDHVALANYPEREVEAKVRLRTAYNRVVDKMKKEIEK